MDRFEFEPSFTNPKQYQETSPPFQGAGKLDAIAVSTYAAQNIHERCGEMIRDFLYWQELESIFSDIGMLCLTEVANSTIMWGHYANAGKGCRLSFKLNDEFFPNHNLSLLGLTKVNYDGALRTYPEKFTSDMLPKIASNKSSY